MGLNEDLCTLTALNEQQLAGLDALAEMTSKQQTAFVRKFKKAWDANVAAVQQAKANLEAAFRDYGRIGTEAGKIIAPLRRKALMGQLSAVEADVVEEQEARVRAASDVVEAAREAHEAAKQTFKAGVTAKQLGI